MKRLTILATAALAAAIALPAYAAPSAKATFTYAALNKVEEAFVGYVVHDLGTPLEVTEECDPETYVPVGDLTCALDFNDMASSGYQVLSSTIKMPKHKELLIDVSLECGNFLDTKVKSKGGDKNSATADATVRVLVLVNDGTGWVAALPSGNPDRDLNGDGATDGATEGVVFCHRSQSLEAKFQGIFTTDVIGWVGDTDGIVYGEDEEACIAGGGEVQTCTLNSMLATCLTNDPDLGVLADLSCFTDEEIRLTTASMTATSFNFMYPNTQQSGVHQVAVLAYLDAGAGLSGDNTNGVSRARALIGLGSMSVQTVRMVRGDIVTSGNNLECSASDACTELD